MRSIIRQLFLSVAGSFSAPQNGVHILNSHFISRYNKDNPAVIYKQLLSQLAPSCQFINVDKAVQLIESGEEIDQCYLAFTFDDGFEECYTDIAPVLEQFGVRACFFINPGFIDGDEDYIQDFLFNKVDTPDKQPMSWAMIQELHQKGHIIGSHTIDHIRLNINDKDLLEAQIAGSKQILEDHLQYDCQYFAFPYGQLSDLSDTALKIAAKYHPYIFSGTAYRQYYSFDGQVFNRRHIEGDWPVSHVKYFISKKKMA